MIVLNKSESNKSDYIMRPRRLVILALYIFVRHTNKLASRVGHWPLINMLPETEFMTRNNLFNGKVPKNA